MTAEPVTTSAAPGAEYADAASAAYRAILQIIESVEPRIAAATRKELADQRDSLKLIASENYASPAALLTMGICTPCIPVSRWRPIIQGRFAGTLAIDVTPVSSHTRARFSHSRSPMGACSPSRNR